MDLPWQAAVRARLDAAAHGGRLSHAVLICGYPGWGETELCAWLALRLLGSAAGRDAKSLAHPDLRWVAPDGGLIKVDQVRALAEFALGTPQAAAGKVAVIERAHAMNLNAANALLKTLEEPPGAMTLILGTDSAGSLAPTVRSRCQIYSIPRNAAQAAQWLSEPAARALLEDYDGAPLQAALGAQSDERPMAELLADLARGRPVIDEMAALDVRRLSARWTRWLVRALAGATELPESGQLSPRRALAFADELTRFHEQVVRTNSVNVRLLLERLCHHWRLLVGVH